MDDLLMNPEIATALKAAEAGAAILRNKFTNLDSISSQNKKATEEDNGYQGIVTEADLQSESVIVDTIRAKFPEHSFLAEESNRDSVDSEHLWIIDPLDGTNNFANGIPHFAVSIAYYRNGTPECGVILDPCRHDLFLTQRNKGAWWNGKAASVNQHQSLEQTMIAVGFYYDRGPMMRATLQAIEDFFGHDIHGIRRFGTAALDLVQVGLGRFGAFFEYELSPWDFAAARLFVEEAGGTITDCVGNPLTLAKGSVLATNSILHPVALSIVKRHLP
ncbi:MAG: inositol monophosphatase family protein [Planctomycetota bacterium]